MSTLAPTEPLSALLMAVPVAVPMNLYVYCGNALAKAGWIRFGDSPESLRSLVPTTVSVDDVSAPATAGATIIAPVARTTRMGAARSRRRKTGRGSPSPRRAVGREKWDKWRIG